MSDTQSSDTTPDNANPQGPLGLPIVAHPEESEDLGEAPGDSTRQSSDDRGKQNSQSQADSPDSNVNTDGAPRRQFEQFSPPKRTPPPSGTKALAPCTIIGASGSGKTSLLFALDRACNLPGADRMKLSFVPKGTAIAELLRKPVTMIIKKKVQLGGTTEPGDLSFWIYVKAPSQRFWGGTMEESLEIVVKDGPGGAIFPPDENVAADKSTLTYQQIEVRTRSIVEIEGWQASLIPHAQIAKALIFCVDATNPRLDLLETYLPDFFARISDEVYIEARPPWYARLANQMGLRYETKDGMPRRILKVNRFLLLLTKIDQLCAHSDEPWKVALALDPVEQAYGLLGPALLNRIHNSLGDEAKFAVGLASAWGFDPETEEPLADADGKAAAIGEEPPEYILLRWRPFGIREAIYFIATGRAEGTVKMVTPEAIWIRPRSKEQEIYVHP